MGIKRRQGSPYWYYDFAVNGVRVRGSTKTEDRAAAKIIAAKLRSDAILQVHTGKKPELSLDEAFARHWLEYGADLRSSETLKFHARQLLRGLGATTLLSAIDGNLLGTYIAGRKPHVANSTINREITVLRSVISRADSIWGIATAFVDWRSLKLRNPPTPERYLTSEEAQRLIEAAAGHLKPIIKFALLTGARRENILRLDWSDIDLQKRQISMRIKSTSTGTKPHVIPISDGLLNLLVSLAPKSTGAVFTYTSPGKRKEGTNPRQIADIKTAWRAAVRRAQIKPARFHDLRHTAASWMVQDGVPLDTVRDILGHSSISVTVRYAHRAIETRRSAMDALASHLRHSDERLSDQSIDKKRKNRN